MGFEHTLFGLETQRSNQLSHRGDATEGNLDTFDSIATSNPSIIYRSIIYRLCVPHRITKKKKHHRKSTFSC